MLYEIALFFAGVLGTGLGLALDPLFWLFVAVLSMPRTRWLIPAAAAFYGLLRVVALPYLVAGEAAVRPDWPLAAFIVAVWCVLVALAFRSVRRWLAAGAYEKRAPQ